MTKELTGRELYDAKREIISVLSDTGEQIFTPEQIKLLRNIIYDSFKAHEIIHTTESDVLAKRTRALLIAKAAKRRTKIDMEFILGNISLEDYEKLQEHI